MTWKREGQDPGIDVSGDGWDSEMIEYPACLNTVNNDTCYTQVITTVGLDLAWPLLTVKSPHNGAPTVGIPGLQGIMKRALPVRECGNKTFHSR